VDAGAGKTQGVFGTPAYMSPEQCASAAAVDARADLYSLGCIFYELVCGRPPFGQGGIELIAAHLRDVPMPPRALAPWLPPAVEQVILRLLEKQQDRRPPSCAALIAALDDAAAASGLPGASVPYLPSSGGVSPASRSFAGVSHATTLGSAAGAASTIPQKRGAGIWLGLGAVVVVAGVIVAVLAMPGRTVAGDGSGGGGSGLLAVADAAVPADAAQVAVVADAAQVALATPDAALDTPIDAAPDAGAGVEPEGPPLRQADIAARLNEEGKKEMYASRFDQAAEKFSEAVARVPEPKYLFNLASAQFQRGHFSDAAFALEALLGSSPSEQLAAKANRLMDEVVREAERQGLTVGRRGLPPESK
jgi:hypothetical protein